MAGGRGKAHYLPVLPLRGMPLTGLVLDGDAVPRLNMPVPPGVCGGCGAPAPCAGAACAGAPNWKPPVALVGVAGAAAAPPPPPPKTNGEPPPEVAMGDG